MTIKTGPFPYDDLYYDCDYILKNGQEINAAKVDNTLYIDDAKELLDDDDLKLLTAFYDDKPMEDFEELSTWPHDIKNSDKKMRQARLAIKYRGGQGYAYGWWLLKAWTFTLPAITW